MSRSVSSRRSANDLKDESKFSALEMSATRSLWPAIAFLPILLAGNLKSLALTTVFGIDTTLVSLILLFGVTGYYLLHRAPIPLADLTPLLLFAALAATSLLWSLPSQEQGDKVTAFFFIAVPCAFAVAVLVRDLRDLRGFLAIWVIAGVTVSLLTVSIPAESALGGRAALGMATLGPAYLAASGALLALFAVSDRWLPLWLGVASFLICVIALFAIGSRGPTIALALGLVWWVASSRLRVLTRLAILGSVALVAFGAFSIASATSRVRLENLSDPSRDALREVAWAGWANRPVFGSGWGSFAFDASVSGLFRGMYTYPHNLFAESATELGILGLLAITAVLVVAGTRVFRMRVVAEVRALGGLAVVLLAGQQFSGDLTNRNLWMALAACLVLPTIVGSVKRPSMTRRPPPRASDR